MEWTPVGNSGNAADQVFPGPTNPDNLAFGTVNYNYRIGTYDVTVDQYVEFLNEKDANGDNKLGLYNTSMSDAEFGGITFTLGNPSGAKYSAMAGREKHPANYTTWYDAIRFANWLNNGQGDGDTEDGAYTLLGGTPTPSNGDSISRNSGAKVFLPSEDEWYKAAYYDPAAKSYFQYPTGNNTIPIASNPTALPNHVNFVTGGSFNVTDVGAYTGTTSPYGAFDMAGNVWQWNETLFSFPNGARGARGYRGGAFYNPVSLALSSARGNFDPFAGNEGIGFRVAAVHDVPEPITAALGVVACGAMLKWRRRCASPSRR
jgi:formylglycine-generating enzyme required for sulfatase activity